MNVGQIELAVYAVIFLCAVFAVQATTLIFARQITHDRAINRRLAQIAKGSTRQENLSSLLRERQLPILEKFPALSGISRLLLQSGIKLGSRQLVLFIAALFIFTFVFAVPLSFNLLSALLFAVLSVSLTALLLLYRLVHKRQARFGEQLPQALDIIVRGLRSGHPFRVSMELAAEELDDPAGTELGITVDEISFGIDQEIAVKNLYNRVGHPDLTFFVTALNLHATTGCNLVEILTKLSTIMRQRATLKLKIQTLSSEGRTSGRILTAIPFIMIVLINVIAPDYYRAVLHTDAFKNAVIIALFLLLIGNAVIYKMINFKF